jgi:serine/threonine protein kinase
MHGSNKPSNVFLCGEDRVILGDLALPLRGISVQLDRLSYDYRYAPPEMFREDGTLGPWSDFYALGCVAYELASGAPPFVSDNHFELASQHVRDDVVAPSRRGSSVGPAGDALFLRFLAKSPADRVQNLVEALQHIDDLHAALVPRVKVNAPSTPILGDASLLRYSTDPALSLVIFPDDLRFVENTTPSNAIKTGSVSMDDTLVLGIDPDPKSSTVGPEQVPSQIGRYIIIREIAKGGLGAVYLALDERMGREVAIKVSSATYRNSPEGQARFDREAMLMARLYHSNIVRIYDMGKEEGSFYTVLEYVDGGDLKQRLRDRAWLPDEAARLVETLARTVEYVHSLGVVHRDLKPSNILFAKDGTPKITDFGLAKLIGEQQEDASDTWEGTVLGTPSYMSPEQARGDIRRVGPAADVHALGAILYELLAGRRPFDGGTVEEMLMQVREYKPEPPSHWRSGIPGDLDAICLRCLEKEPERRYSIAAALADDLERFLAGKVITGRPLGAWERLRRLFSSKKSPAGQDPP